MKKELKIVVRINGDEVKSLMYKEGFTKDAAGIFDVVGILENLKKMELDKLNVNHKEKINFDDDHTIVFK